MIATRLELQEMVDLLLGSHERAGAAARELASTRVELGGRGGARRLVLPGGKAVYLRKYRRGGMVRHFVKDLYLRRPERPLRELVVTEAARAAGCPVPTVLAVCIEEAGPFYRGWIVTAAIDRAAPLIDAYTARGPAEREILLADVGRAVRSLHDAGVYHVDLTGHNVIIDEQQGPVLIDFDRAFRDRPDMRGHADRGLDRLWRSMTKLCATRAVDLEEEQRRWLMRGYNR